MAMDSRTSAEDSNPVWIRWFLPPISDLFFVALVGVLVFTNLSVRLLGDAGIGWHIRTGQIILATHAIPHVDPFSSSMSGYPWFAWEWLYDVLVGWLESATGLNGVVLWTALIIATVFSWTFRLLLHRGTNIAVALILVLLAASASMIHFLARPHVVSWLFTVAWFWILESSENDRTDSNANFSATSAIRRARLWLLPLITLLWVNLHGGFLLGFALLAIYWVSAAGQWLRLTLTLTEDRFENFLRELRAGRRLRALTFVGIVSAAATLLNPYGFKLHFHIYHYLTNRFLMDHIDEFQSPNFHYVAQKCFAALLLLSLLALATKRRGISVSHGLVLLFAVYSGLYASRNIPVSSLLSILVIGPWLSDAMARLAASLRTPARWRRLAYTQFLHRMEGIELSLRGHLWPIAAIVLTCWIVAHGGKLGAAPLMNAHFDTKRFPVAAVDYLKKNSLEKQDLQGPLLSPDSWGGYLIYEMYPEFYPRVKVVIDDRHDFYGEEFLKSYLKMIHGEFGWEGLLEVYQIHCVMVPKGSPLANILSKSPPWKNVYADDVAAIFERPAAVALP